MKNVNLRQQRRSDNGKLSYVVEWRPQRGQVRFLCSLYRQKLGRCAFDALCSRRKPSGAVFKDSLTFNLTRSDALDWWGSLKSTGCPFVMQLMSSP
jgi:hypothetical protein